jgi:hypothetical protein
MVINEPRIDYVIERNSSEPVTTSCRELYRVDEFVQLPEFSYLTRSSLRHLIFNSQPRYSASGDKLHGNGLVEAGAIIRIGRRVLIDAARFREWTHSQREVLAKA